MKDRVEVNRNEYLRLQAKTFQTLFNSVENTKSSDILQQDLGPILLLSPHSLGHRIIEVERIDAGNNQIKSRFQMWSEDVSYEFSNSAGKFQISNILAHYTKGEINTLDKSHQTHYRDHIHFFNEFESHWKDTNTGIETKLSQPLIIDENNSRVDTRIFEVDYNKDNLYLDPNFCIYQEVPENLPSSTTLLPEKVLEKFISLISPNKEGDYHSFHEYSQLSVEELEKIIHEKLSKKANLYSDNFTLPTIRLDGSISPRVLNKGFHDFYMSTKSK